MKILAIVGSLRKDSLNKQLALAAQQMVGDKAEFVVLDYADVPLFNQDIEYPAPAAIARVRQEVEAADGIWFFTPEYNHFFSGVLKNLIDWLSRPQEGGKTNSLDGKPVAISGISLGGSGTLLAQDNLVALISFLNMKVMNVPRLFIPNAMSQMQGSQLELAGSKPYLAKQAEAFIEFTKNNK